MVVLIVLSLGVKILCCLHLYICFHIVTYVWATEWPLIRKIASHSAYHMFAWYKYMILLLFVFFFHLSFCSGNLFLIAPFPDRCLLVTFSE